MSQHEPSSATPPQPASGQAGPPPGYSPAAQSAPYQPAGHQPTAPGFASVPPTSGPKQRNVIGLIALVVAVVGFIFACIPGALIVGWLLLPVAFILAIVSFFQRGKGKGLGIAALIVSVVGTIVGAIVFFAVVASSFEEAFSEGSTVVTQPSDAAASQESVAAPTEAPAVEPAADASQGTRDNPLPVGSTISNDEWTVTVDAVNTDGNAVVAANQFNDAPPAGSHYEVVTYTVTYTGDESSFAAMVGLDLVTSAGNVVNSYDTLVLLDDSMGGDELFTGASATGSAAFLVPDGETALVRVRPGMFGDEVFVQP